MPKTPEDTFVAPPLGAVVEYRDRNDHAYLRGVVVQVSNRGYDLGVDPTAIRDGRGQRGLYWAPNAIIVGIAL